MGNGGWGLSEGRGILGVWCCDLGCSVEMRRGMRVGRFLWVALALSKILLIADLFPCFAGVRPW